MASTSEVFANAPVFAAPAMKLTQIKAHQTEPLVEWL
jgi:hypothetical protein